MEQLRMKIKTLKGIMTKNMSKLETMITAFEKKKQNKDLQPKSEGKLKR